MARADRLVVAPRQVDRTFFMRKYKEFVRAPLAPARYWSDFLSALPDVPFTPVIVPNNAARLISRGAHRCGGFSNSVTL